MSIPNSVDTLRSLPFVDSRTASPRPLPPCRYSSTRHALCEVYFPARGSSRANLLSLRCSVPSSLQAGARLWCRYINSASKTTASPSGKPYDTRRTPTPHPADTAFAPFDASDSMANHALSAFVAHKPDITFC